MGRVSRGSEYQLFLFQEVDGTEELVKVIQPKSMSFSPNINVDRQERAGTTESVPRPTYSGWKVTATFERESFALDDMIDLCENDYYDGSKITRMEIIAAKEAPELGGATRSYRYKNAVISSYEDRMNAQKDPVELNVEFETGRREEL